MDFGHKSRYIVNAAASTSIILLNYVNWICLWKNYNRL